MSKAVRAFAFNNVYFYIASKKHLPNYISPPPFEKKSSPRFQQTYSHPCERDSPPPSSIKSFPPVSNFPGNTLARIYARESTVARMCTRGRGTVEQENIQLVKKDRHRVSSRELTLENNAAELDKKARLVTARR